KTTVSGRRSDQAATPSYVATIHPQAPNITAWSSRFGRHPSAPLPGGKRRNKHNSNSRKHKMRTLIYALLSLALAASAFGQDAPKKRASASDEKTAAEGTLSTPFGVAKTTKPAA